MGEQRYKVGDWVRSLVDWGAVEAGKVYKIPHLDNEGEPWFTSDGASGWCDYLTLGEVEPWQPRVGERVRYSGKSQAYSEKELVGLEGVVTEVGGRMAIVKWDKAIVDGIGTGGAKFFANLEPILSTATPEQPATIKIEAGKFYETRDGRKVGPMVVDGPAWTPNGGLHWYREDGCRYYSGDRGSDTDLIAEWIDEPVDKASNDNRADAGGGFKAGDKIRLVRNPAGRCKIGDEFVAVARGSNGGYASSVHYTDGDGSMTWRPGSYFELVTPPTTTAIVAIIEGGQPKPSSTPHVHTSTGAAEKEAKRLAGKYKGQQFGVFTLTTTHEEAAPVYDHKWQNLAALGLKIDAIKELRSVTGIGLKPAKDAVEYFLAA